MALKEKQIVPGWRELRGIVAELQRQDGKLDDMVLRTPTGYPREQLTGARILLNEAINNLLEVC